MAAGVLQPGGAGTTIFVYDNAGADAGGDGSYSMADIKAAMDIIRPGQSDIEYMGGLISGNVFSIGRRQYMLNVGITFGGQGSDGTNPTTWKDTNVDIYQRAGVIGYRAGGGPIETRLGTKIGSEIAWPGDPTVGGRDGITYISNGSALFRNDLYIYGCRIQANVLTFQQTGSTVQEVSGNLLIAAGANNVFGNSSSVGQWFNNTLVLTGGGNAINGLLQTVGRGNRIFVGSPLQIISIPGSQASGRFQGMVLGGTPSQSDFRAALTDYRDVYYIDVVHTDNAPRWSFAANVSGGLPANGVKQMARYNTKVVNEAGGSLVDIPIRVYNDMDGLILDTKTFGEGDVGFTHPPSGFQNAMTVREHYMAGGVYTVRDRVFTVYANVAGGAFPVNRAYPGRVLRFQWPGRNVYKGMYQLNGGTFTPCYMPIMLGTVGTVPATWEHCEVGMN